MKKVIALALALSSLSSFACSDIRMGDNVIIKWDSGDKAMGKVRGFKGESALLEMDTPKPSILSVKTAPLKKVFSLNNSNVIKVGDAVMIVWDSGIKETVQVTYITASGEIGYTANSYWTELTEIECRKLDVLVDSIVK